MKTITNIALAASLSLLSVVCTAQTDRNIASELLNTGKSYIDRITRGHYDSTYVDIPEYRWSVSVSVDADKTWFNMDVPVPDINEAVESDEEMARMYPDFPQLSTYKFRLHQGAQGASVAVGYGSLRAKYAFNLGSHAEHQLSVECLGSSFGGLIDYRRTKKMRGSAFDAYMAAWERLDDPYPDPDKSTEDVIKDCTTDIDQYRNNYATLHLQGHYVFNNRRFSYSAASSTALVQKRSAGSPIVLADFYMTKAKFASSLLLGYDESYTTWKAAVGAGYAYNYTPNAGRLLIHASVIPSLTLFGHSDYSTTLYSFDDYVYTEYEFVYDEPCPDDYPEAFKEREPERYEEMQDLYRTKHASELRFYDELKTKIDTRSKLKLNCTARLAVVWNINKHYVLSAYGAYQFSNYSNQQRYRISEHRVSGYMALGYRF